MELSSVWTNVWTAFSSWRVPFEDRPPLEPAQDPIGVGRRKVALRWVRKAQRAVQRGQTDVARVCYEEALDLYRQLGALEEEIECLLELGCRLSRLGDKVGGLACLKRASGLSWSSDPALRFRASMTMGEMLLEQNSPWLALACYREALIQAGCPQEIPDLPEAGPLRDALVRVLREKLTQGRELMERSQYQEARRSYQEGLTLARDPLFQPFSSHRFPYQLSHYEGLILLELAHLQLRADTSLGGGTANSAVRAA